MLPLLPSAHSFTLKTKNSFLKLYLFHVMFVNKTMLSIVLQVKLLIDLYIYTNTIRLLSIRMRYSNLELITYLLNKSFFPIRSHKEPKNTSPKEINKGKEVTLHVAFTDRQIKFFL